MSRLTLFFGVLAAGLVLLIINHDKGQTFGIANDEFASLIYLLPITTLIGAGILASRENLGRNLKYLGIWIVIALALVTAYLYRGDALNTGARLAAEFLPGSPFVVTTVDGRQEVVVRKRRNGHFMLTADIGGQSIPMLVDTGASQIALTFEDAERLGLEPQSLDFNQRIFTANGASLAARATLPQIAIGPIQRKNVAASVVPKGAMQESLLGMNFLSSLSSIRIEPDEMRLTE